VRYDGRIYRPPSEADAYILQATVGCSWNHCTYCDMYRQKDFRVRPVEDTLADIAMAKATYELLASLAGKIASVCGATQIRAGVIRPEVVVPGAGGEAADDADAGGLEIGSPVRCIRAPYFGRIGKVSALPVELATMPSETRVRVLDVDLGGGEIISVPRANVEVIER
jgi:hypothetical protein